MEPTKRSKNVPVFLNKNWQEEMRQLLLPTSSLDQKVLDRITKHIYNCYSMIDSFQTSSLFFLLDCTRMEYLFVSRSVESVLGFTRNEIMDNGFQWLLTLLQPAELVYKKTVAEDFFNFLKPLGREKIMATTVRYDIVAFKKDGSKVHLLEEVMFPEVDESGDPLVLSCFLHDIGDYVNSDERQCHIYYQSTSGPQLIFGKAYNIRQEENCPLSRRELEVLEQFSKGLTTSQVATTLFVAENTIKTHRKNILVKLQVRNMAEAIKISTKNKWIY